MLDKIKLALRLDSDIFDTDIQDTIEAAKQDLILSGIAESKIVDTDYLILRAIKIFCKAEYSSNDKEAERYKQSYESLKSHLALSSNYNTDVIEE